MKTPDKSIEAIGLVAAYYEEKLASLCLAQQCLSIPFKGIVYEVHIQSDFPGCTPILAMSDSLLDACCQARRLDLEYNKRGHASMELFVRCGEILVALDPSDASRLLPDDDRGDFTFSLDPRLVGVSPQRLVFKVGERLPSAHYAVEPTPEPVTAGS